MTYDPTGDDLSGVEYWQPADEVRPDLHGHPSTLSGEVISPGQYAIVMSIDPSQVAVTGTIAELRTWLERISTDLTAASNAMASRADQARTWCVWCSDSIEHVRVPLFNGPHAYWIHIRTGQVACPRPVNFRDAAPILDPPACAHCGLPVARIPEHVFPHVPGDPPYYWHLTNRIARCSRPAGHPRTVAQPLAS